MELNILCIYMSICCTPQHYITLYYLCLTYASICINYFFIPYFLIYEMMTMYGVNIQESKHLVHIKKIHIGVYTLKKMILDYY